MQSKLTIFTTCKPFYGVVGIHQENAIHSWHKLGVPILLLGNEYGTDSICRELDLIHIPEVSRNKDGLPIVNDLFHLAELNSEAQYLAYLNADIMLLPDLLDTLIKVDDWRGEQPCLLTSRRKNIPLNQRLDFNNKSYANHLSHLSCTQGSWDYPYAIDLFLFSRGLFKKIPKFSIGRPMWDNWMLWKAREMNAAILDASGSIGLMHPIHGYEGGWAEVTYGEGAKNNRALSVPEVCTIENSCTHFIDGGEIFSFSDSERSKNNLKFKPDTKKELIAYLQFASEGLPLNNKTVIDDLRAMLWRWQLFFPLGDKSVNDFASLRALLIEARGLCISKRYDSALNLLQDFICERFLITISNAIAHNKTVYIWGAGQYGRRVKALLDRHDLKVAGFLDKNAAVFEKQDNVYPVSKLRDNKKDKFFIIIATMYFEEVKAELHKIAVSPDNYAY